VARAGAWALAATIAAAIGLALWSGSSIPDPIGRGSDAPDFALPALGEPGDPELRLSSLRGQVVLLNFWATWCKPCEDEMPTMQRLHAALASEGLALLAVSVDDTREVVEEFRARFALTFPILWDPERRVAQEYQAFRFPETLLIDREGVVIERYIGPREWDAPLYEARIRRLLSGQP
jgi:cytochrome c biogenesis protein CcmG, thiol:disulfide interchange protein DsbE